MWARPTNWAIFAGAMCHARSHKCLRSSSRKLLASNICNTKCSPTISGSREGTRSAESAPVMVSKIDGCTSIFHEGKSGLDTFVSSVTARPPIIVASARPRSSSAVAPAGCQYCRRSRSMTSAIRRSESSARQLVGSRRIASAIKCANNGRLSGSISLSLSSVSTRGDIGAPASESTYSINNDGSVTVSSFIPMPDVGEKSMSGTFRLVLSSVSIQSPPLLRSSSNIRTGRASGIPCPAERSARSPIICSRTLLLLSR